MKKIFITLLLAAGTLLSGTEYFLGTNGNDRNPGVDRNKPFATLQKAVNALQPGDTLTILPGAYFGAALRKFGGAPDKQTVIRGERPDTVLIHGDVSAPEFKPVSGQEFTWVADWNRPVEAVNEIDTLSLYRRVPSLEEVRYRAPAWYLDEKERKLYLATSDLESPSAHRLLISVINASGLELQPPDSDGRVHNVLIENLAFRGFASGVALGQFKFRWGLKLTNPSHCTARQCTAFANAAGLLFEGAADCVIEDSTGYANGTQFGNSGGSIIMYTPAERSVIRRCLSFSSHGNAFRFYGGGKDAIQCRIEDCIASGGSTYIKTGGEKDSEVVNVTSDKGIAATVTRNSTYIWNNYVKGNQTYNSLHLRKEKMDRAKRDRLLADPENMDYHPQSDSGLTVGIPFDSRIRYLAPNGKDAGEATSVKSAWKTLAHAVKNLPENGILYILPGTYAGDVTITTPGVTLATRGLGAYAIISGGKTGITAAAPGVTIRHLNFLGQSESSVAVRADRVKVADCGFANTPLGITAVGVKGLEIRNNSNITYRLDKCPDSFSYANILEAPGTGAGMSLSDLSPAEFQPQYTAPEKGDFSLKNAPEVAGRSFLGLAIGQHRMRQEPPPLNILKTETHSVTATTANLEMWTNRAAVSSTLHWGDTPECKNELPVIMLTLYGQPREQLLHTISLAGLQPGKKYYYRFQGNLRQPAPYDYMFPVSTATSGLMEFTTLPADAAPATYHVSTTGDDANPGNPEKPFRSISHAADMVKAGDTVVIKAGTYSETVRLRATGDQGKPIIFRAERGTKVVMDGLFAYNTAFQIFAKSHIKIEGINFSGFAGGDLHGVFLLTESPHITIEGCLYDGRTRRLFTSEFVTGYHADNFVFRNNFVLGGYEGIVLHRSDNPLIANNLFYLSVQGSLLLLSNRKMTSTITHNIFYDQNLNKERSPVLICDDPDKLVEAYNCYYMRLPQQTRIWLKFEIFMNSSKPPEGLIIEPALRGERKVMTFDDYHRLTGKKPTSFYADPKIDQLVKLRPYRDYEHWLKQWRSDNYEPGGPKLGELDFEHCFPNPPLVGADGRPIGLDPSRFVNGRFQTGD